jgi:hypothetical protein
MKWRRWTIIVVNEGRRRKSSNVEVDNVLEQPMRKKIVSSRELAVKRKKRPGKAGKPVRAPKLHKSSSSYEDETDPSNDDDGKLFSGRRSKAYYYCSRRRGFRERSR